MRTDLKLGDKVKERITGCEGIVIGRIERIEYLWGCIQYAIQGKKDKDGKAPDFQWFDEDRLEIIKKDEYSSTKKKDTGGICQKY